MLCGRQAPGDWHPTEKGGCYEIDDPPAWARISAPYIRKLVSVLKHAAPLAGPAVGMIAPEYAAIIKNDIDLMTELVKIMPELEEDRESRLMERIGMSDDPERMGGAALRALRELLDEKDKDHYWGGLKKVLTPEGHYLWLCEHHAKPYAL